MLSAIGFFLVLLFLGMPVAFAIAVSGFAFFVMRPEIPWTILVQKSLSTTQSFYHAGNSAVYLCRKPDEQHRYYLTSGKAG